MSIRVVSYTVKQADDPPPFYGIAQLCQDVFPAALRSELFVPTP